MTALLPDAMLIARALAGVIRRRRTRLAKYSLFVEHSTIKS
jgi:hypothetical protein